MSLVPAEGLAFCCVIMSMKFKTEDMVRFTLMNIQKSKWSNVIIFLMLCLKYSIKAIQCRSIQPIDN